MFYSPLLALFMAFAATSGVVASTTPLRRGGVPPHPATAPTAGNCNAVVSCCNDAEYVNDILVGLKCSPLSVLTGNPTCDAHPLCCQDTQNGLINIDCVQFDL